MHPDAGRWSLFIPVHPLTSPVISHCHRDPLFLQVLPDESVSCLVRENEAMCRHFRHCPCRKMTSVYLCAWLVFTEKFRSMSGACLVESEDVSNGMSCPPYHPFAAFRTYFAGRFESPNRPAVPVMNSDVHCSSIVGARIHFSYAVIVANQRRTQELSILRYIRHRWIFDQFSAIGT